MCLILAAEGTRSARSPRLKLAAGLAVMSRKGAIRILDGEFPIDHAVRATDEIGAFKASLASMKVSMI